MLQQMVPLKLHSDHATTGLCPVRAHLVCLHIIGLKGDYHFPTREELLNPPFDFVYKTYIDYQCFLKDLKDVCKATLPTRTPELKTDRLAGLPQNLYASSDRQEKTGNHSLEGTLYSQAETYRF